MREWCKFCGQGDGVCERCQAREDLKIAERKLSDARSVLRVLSKSSALVYEDRDLVMALLIRLGPD